MSLLVRSVAGHATLQDFGRPGWRHFGVPPAGIWDREAAALANALVGNAPDTAIVELALGTLEVEALAATSIAWVGADADGRKPLARGDIVRIGPPRRARVVLATPGGFAAPKVMGSVSGRPVSAGAQLVPEREDLLPSATLADPSPTLAQAPFRVLPGPQSDRFDLEAFSRADYCVDNLSDRVGLRLSGPTLGPGGEIVSEPACPGAIQITGEGRPIVLGPDGPTIGGYPKIGFVCAADLDRLGQLRPGDRFTARWLDLDEARSLAEERANRIARRVAGIRLALAAS